MHTETKTDTRTHARTIDKARRMGVSRRQVQQTRRR